MPPRQPREQITVDTADHLYCKFSRAAFKTSSKEIIEKYFSGEEFPNMYSVQKTFYDTIPDLVLDVSKEDIIDLGKGIDPNYKYPSKSVLAEKTALQTRARELVHVSSWSRSVLNVYLKEKYNREHPDAREYDFERMFMTLVGAEMDVKSVEKAEQFYRERREASDDKQRAELVAEKLMEFVNIKLENIDLTDDRSILDNFETCEKIARIGEELQGLNAFIAKHLDLSDPRFAKYRENAALLYDMGGFLGVKLDTMASTAYPFFNFPEVSGLSNFKSEKYTATNAFAFLTQAQISDESFINAFNEQFVAQTLTTREGKVMVDKSLTPVQRIDAYKAKNVDTFKLNTAKISSEKEAFTAQLEKNLRLYKEAVPEVDFTDDEKRAMLSEENIVLYNMAKARMARHKSFEDRFRKAPVPTGFQRILTCMLDKSDTPEADSYNRDLISIMSGLSAKSVEFLKQKWAESINKVIDLDLNKLTAPGAEGIKYAMDHFDEMMTAWTVGDILANYTSVGFDAKNDSAQRKIDEYKSYCQTVGAYGSQLFQFAADGSLFTFPLDKFKEEHIPKLFSSKDSDFKSLCGSVTSFKAGTGFEADIKKLAASGKKPKHASTSLLKNIKRPELEEQKAAEDKKNKEYEIIRKTVSKQLAENIETLKQEYPGFDVSKKQFDAYISDRHIEMHQRAKEIMARVQRINNIKSVDNGSEKQFTVSPFDRILPFIVGDEELEDVLKNYKNDTPEGAAMRYELWQRATDKMMTLDVSKFSKDVPEEAQMEYVANNPDAVFAAYAFNDFALRGLENTGVSLSAEQTALFTKLRSDMQAIGGLGQSLLEYMATDAFLTVPEKQMSSAMAEDLFYGDDSEELKNIDLFQKVKRVKDLKRLASENPVEITQKDLDPKLYITWINEIKEKDLNELPENEAAEEEYIRIQEELFNKGVKKTNKMHDELEDFSQYPVDKVRRWALEQSVEARDELTNMVGRDPKTLDLQKVTRLMATVYVCEYAKANPAFTNLKKTEANCMYFAKITKTLSENETFKKGIENTLRGNVKENEIGKDMINRFLAGRGSDMKEIGTKLGLRDVLNQAIAKVQKPNEKEASPISNKSIQEFVR